MQKIPSLFKRNHDTEPRLVRDEVVEGSEWVLKGEGVATRKWDGTACLFKGGKLWKRYDRKLNRQGKRKPAPEGWVMCETEPNEHTGHWPGWIPIGDEPESWMHREALELGCDSEGRYLAYNRTYELCGPSVNGNPEGLEKHVLIEHGDELVDARRDFKGLREFFKTHDVEGVVWWRDDGRMVKIKGRDFGVARQTKTR